MAVPTRDKPGQSNSTLVIQVHYEERAVATKSGQEGLLASSIGEGVGTGLPGRNSIW